MTIRCQCEGCGNCFQAPDRWSGQAVLCPVCKAEIHVPKVETSLWPSEWGNLQPQTGDEHTTRENGEQSGPAWFLRDANGQHHGPMTKTALDHLAENDRVDCFCQVRCADWEEWRWIETVYPKYAEHNTADTDTVSAGSNKAGLIPDSKAATGGEKDRASNGGKTGAQFVDAKLAQSAGRSKPADDVDKLKPKQSANTPANPAKAARAADAQQQVGAAGLAAETNQTNGQLKPLQPTNRVRQQVAATESRLQECPDCGKMVSRRAAQCPDCGCPIASVGSISTELLDEELAAGVPLVKRRIWTSRTALLFVLLCVLIVLLTACVMLGRLLRQQAGQPTELLKSLIAPQATAAQTATPEQIAAWIEEVADTTARELDNGYRQLHLARTGIQAMQQQTDLLQSLASGNFAKSAKHDKNQPERKPPPAYQSQYEPLRQECADYLRQNVNAATADREAVVALAKSWSESRRSSLEKALEEQIGAALGQ